MTINYTEEYNARERVRRRRRRIVSSKRELLKHKKRSKVFTIMSICVMAAVLGYIGVSDGGSGFFEESFAYVAEASENQVYVDVIVNSGDTIWSIASLYADPSRDIRDHIREICEHNNIKAGNIYPGQLIQVPI